MSINALKEFMIHFHTYRNVDLINQGLYQIRARIHYTENKIKYYAIPYFYSESKGSENLLRSEESSIKPHNIIPNHISENNWEYVSKTFLIRYYDEEVEIDEFCYFRLELPSSLLNKKILYHIEFELFFSDALLALESDRKGINFNANNNNINNNNINEDCNSNMKGNNGNNNVLNNVEFKSAACQISYINYDAECPGYVECFNPVVYGDAFFSILNTSVHMVILDYKLRLNNFSAYSSQGVSALWAKDNIGGSKSNEKGKDSSNNNNNSNINKKVLGAGKNKNNNSNEKSESNNISNYNTGTYNNINNFKYNSTDKKQIGNNNKTEKEKYLTENLSSSTNKNITNFLNNDKNTDLNSKSNNNNSNTSDSNNVKANKDQRKSDAVKKNLDFDMLYNSNSNNGNNNDNLNSLIQFFIDDKLNKLTGSSLTAELVDELYESYVVSMIKNYFSIRKKYERLMKKLIYDKIKSEFPFFIVNFF